MSQGWAVPLRRRHGHARRCHLQSVDRASAHVTLFSHPFQSFKAHGLRHKQRHPSSRPALPVNSKSGGDRSCPATQDIDWPFLLMTRPVRIASLGTPLHVILVPSPPPTFPFASPTEGRPAPPLCDIPSGCCFFTGPWTVTRSSLRRLRRVAAFCRPLRPVLLLVLFPRLWSPVVGVLGLCWMRQDVPFAR